MIPRGWCNEPLSPLILWPSYTSSHVPLISNQVMDVSVNVCAYEPIVCEGNLSWYKYTWNYKLWCRCKYQIHWDDKSHIVICSQTYLTSDSMHVYFLNLLEITLIYKLGLHLTTQLDQFYFKYSWGARKWLSLLHPGLACQALLYHDILKHLVASSGRSF
jgi:hypothetical protein